MSANHRVQKKKAEHKAQDKRRRKAQNSLKKTVEQLNPAVPVSRPSRQRKRPPRVYQDNWYAHGRDKR